MDSGDEIFTGTVSDGDVVVTMDIAVRDGRYRIVRLEVAADAVTGSTLRALPVSRLSRSVAKQALKSRWQLCRSDEPLARIAATYERACLMGEPPTIAVAKELGVSRATAGRRIAHARKEGFLN